MLLTLCCPRVGRDWLTCIYVHKSRSLGFVTCCSTISCCTCVCVCACVSMCTQATDLRTYVHMYVQEAIQIFVQYNIMYVHL